jgi:hypothetical protein
MISSSRFEVFKIYDLQIKFEGHIYRIFLHVRYSLLLKFCLELSILKKKIGYTLNLDFEPSESQLVGLIIKASRIFFDG